MSGVFINFSEDVLPSNLKNVYFEGETNINQSKFSHVNTYSTN